MNILSLFNGISGLHLAFDRAGIKVDTCYYSEIDKFANKVTEHHYPNDIALGDVTKWKDWSIDWSSIDFVSAGFPCQAWSVAGKQLGDKDERGMLFWTTLDIIAYVLKNNPNAKFLMENVKMKKDFEEYITHHTEQSLGYVEKTLINSALVSAQNRERYYWTNFKVTVPHDNLILVKDILSVNHHVVKFYNIMDNKRVYGISEDERGFRPYKGDKSKSGISELGRVLKINSTKTDTVTSAHQPKLAVMPAKIKKGEILDITYRKLTPLECERLQTLPDNWTECLSNTQRYKSIGNGWTIDVISHILKCAYF
jgi:DNA-cytosine methyltransferase